MTNDQIAALVAAAEDCTKPHGYLTAEYFQTLANPSAILSLVERLREAEEALREVKAGLNDMIDRYACRAFTGTIVSPSEQYPWVSRAMNAEAAVRAYMEKNT